MITKDSEHLHHKARKDKIIKNAARILISVIAIFCLIKFGKVDLNTAIKYLIKANPLYFGLACILYLITVLISATRFYFSSSAVGFQKRYFQLLQLNFIGAFFNNFLPTTFGGDALRGYYLKKGTHIPLSKAVACIVYERYTGLIVLFWAASFIFMLQSVNLISEFVWEIPKEFIMFTHIGSFVTIFVIPFLPQINRLFLGKINWLHTNIIEPVIVYWNDLRLMTKILILSFVLQTCVVLSHFFIAVALNIHIPLSYYFVFYPLTTIAGFMIPSLNGLGVREGTYIYFLSKVGVSSDQGLAFSLCWLIILLGVSVIGGMVYAFGDFRKHKPLELNE